MNLLCQQYQKNLDVNTTVTTVTKMLMIPIWHIKGHMKQIRDSFFLNNNSYNVSH